MRVSEIRVKQICVNQGLGVQLYTFHETLFSYQLSKYHKYLANIVGA